MERRLRRPGRRHQHDCQQRQLRLQCRRRPLLQSLDARELHVLGRTRRQRDLAADLRHRRPQPDEQHLARPIGRRHRDCIGRQRHGEEPRHHVRQRRLRRPRGASEFTHKSYDAAIQVLNVTGNVLFSHCRIHGANNNVNISGSTGVVFDHCRFYDNVAGSGSAGHGNMVQYAGNDNVTFRYNEWWNWSVEGIMVWTPSGALYVYGNVFHDADNDGYPSVIQANNTTAGPLYFYNNTIANVSGFCVFRPASSVGWTSGSQARNNLYWNSDVCVQSAPTSDYDASYNDLAVQQSNPSSASPETMTVAAGRGPRLHRPSGALRGRVERRLPPHGQHAGRRGRRRALRRGQGRQRQDDLDARRVRISSIAPGQALSLLLFTSQQARDVLAVAERDERRRRSSRGRG